MERRRLGRLFLLYVALDVVCVGAGMGVPIFCIVLGLPVGWRLVGLLGLPSRPPGDALAGLLRGAAVTAGVTLAMMAALWSLAVPKLFAPPQEIATFGIPLVLYEPRASLAGWLVLMVLVSPVLQFLVTIFGGHLALLREARRAERT